MATDPNYTRRIVDTGEAMAAAKRLDQRDAIAIEARNHYEAKRKAGGTDRELARLAFIVAEQYDQLGRAHGMSFYAGEIKNWLHTSDAHSEAAR